MEFEKGTVTKCLSYRDRRVDEIISQVHKYIELRSGFGESHVKSRTLQSVFRSSDINIRNNVSVTELMKVFRRMNISVSQPDEAEDFFDCFDLERTGYVECKLFSDAVFGVVQAPYGNVDVRNIARRIKMALYHRTPPSDSVVSIFARLLMNMKNRDSSNPESQPCVIKEDLFNVLQKFGIKDISIADMDVLLKHFNDGKNGYICIPEFLRSIRGRIPSVRLDLIERVFFMLDVNDKGLVSMREMLNRFDPTFHPRVISSQKSCDDIMRDFADAFWDKSADKSYITLEEWLCYYTDVSAGIDRDDYFEMMMRNCWHIPEVNCNSESVTHRQVLVSYKDGHKTIENIKDGFDDGMSNKAKIMADLRTQGISDVLKVELYR